MYVCNCNGIRARQVDEAIEAGARRPSAVHTRYGCKPQCGRCLPEIAERMRARGAAADQGAACGDALMPC